MSKKGWKAGAVLAAGAGITAVLAARKRGNRNAEKTDRSFAGSRSDYRNTELGKHDKNSKGIYYTNGNYEAFARPEKPAGIEEKSAYLVGSGLASLAAACFLVRDAQMPGKNIHILEAMDIAGGACDGIDDPTRGYVMRGGREMEDHFECLWDLFHSIPSLEIPGASVLDEYYWLNKHDPNYSLCRATEHRGEDAHTDGKFRLSQKGSMEIMKLFFTKDEDLYDKTIEDVFDDEVFRSDFWLYWRTMFAFENWHSALEMKRYFQRFIHHIGGLPDFSALKFTRYNQYESLILPMQKYLEAAGVEFRFGTEVTNVRFEIKDGKKTARAIECRTKNGEMEIPLTEKDLVFITNGSCTEGTIYGDQDHAPLGDAEVRSSGCWSLWKKIAAQDPAFGHPEKFCSDIEKTNWESATVTTSNEEIVDQIKKICRRDPRTGKVVTGGIVSCRDSSWLLSWTINRQGQFKNQKKDEVCVWVYSLFTDVPGDHVKKPMKECTGKEITAEWLYHLGIPVEDIDRLAGEACNCTPTMMPYITAFFMPRRAGDRPDVIPDGSVNAAFLGQFAETPRDTIFTTEYSVRTAMEAVYGLCGVDRGVPEVWGSVYDVRELLDSTVKLMDGKSPLEMKLPMPFEMMKKPLLRKIDRTIIGKLLRDHDVLKDWMLK
ncbi:oleate hydratase [Clostridium sp. AM16-23]|nr:MULTISPECIES: oleate hydratase [unclassified Clostridium]RHO40773.1 oleate hydratase [Clostridium sp. AM16-23]RHS66451.1 oleate hydratase [Clostridium sp. AM45-5]